MSKTNLKVALMAVCPNCAEQLPDNAKFCLNCGAKVKTAESLVEEGREHYNAGRFEEAIKYFDEAIELEPENPRAWFNKAIALKDWGISLKDASKVRASVEAFNKALEGDSKNSEIWFNRGTSLDYLEDLEGALESFEKAVELNPQNESYRKAYEDIKEKLEKKTMPPVETEEKPLEKKVSVSEMEVPFPERYTALISGPPGVGKYEYCLELVKRYLLGGESVVFITTERSPRDIKKRLKTLGVDLDKYEGKKFMFIDVYSYSTGERYEKGLHIDNPANLNAISVQLSKAAEKIGKPVRIFFDSLSTLFLHAADPEIKKFFGTLSSRVRSEYGFILYTLQEEMHDEKTVIALRHMVDAVLEMKFEEGPPLKRYFRVHHAKELKVSPSWFEFTITDRGFNIIGEKIVKREEVAPVVKPAIVSPTVIKAGIAVAILLLGVVVYQLISPGTEKVTGGEQIQGPSPEELFKIEAWIKENPDKWEELKAKYGVENPSELSKEEASEIIAEFVSVKVTDFYSLDTGRTVIVNGEEVPASIEIKNRVDLRAPDKGWLIMENPFYKIELNLDHPYYLLRDKISNKDVLVFNDKVENPIDMITGCDMGFADHTGENKIQWSTTALHDNDGITRYKIVYEDKENGFILLDTEGWDVLSQDPFAGYDVEGEVMFGIFADKPYFIEAVELDNLQKMGLALPKNFRNPDEIVVSWVLQPDYSSAVIKGGDPNHLNRRLYEELYEVREIAEVGRKPYHFGSAAFSKMFPTHHLLGDKRGRAVIFSLPPGRFRFDDSLGVYGEQVSGEFILYVEKPQKAVAFTVEPVNELEFLYDVKDFNNIEGYKESMEEILRRYGLEYPGGPLDHKNWTTKRFAYVVTLTRDWYNPATNKPKDEIWSLADEGLSDFKKYENIIYKQMESTLPIAMMLAGR
jgi:KaiC/GvpD/RAD55 family RecA-like ATPase